MSLVPYDNICTYQESPTSTFFAIHPPLSPFSFSLIPACACKRSLTSTNKRTRPFILHRTNHPPFMSKPKGAGERERERWSQRPMEMFLCRLCLDSLHHFQTERGNYGAKLASIRKKKRVCLKRRIGNKGKKGEKKRVIIPSFLYISYVRQSFLFVSLLVLPKFISPSSSFGQKKSSFVCYGSLGGKERYAPICKQIFSMPRTNVVDDSENE